MYIPLPDWEPRERDQVEPEFMTKASGLFSGAWDVTLWTCENHARIFGSHQSAVQNSTQATARAFSALVSKSHGGS